MENDSFLYENKRKKENCCTCKRCCIISVIVMATLFIAFLIFGIVIAVLAAGPLHAQCKVEWDIGLNCSVVEERLISQMKIWHTRDNCKQGGQRCLYEYKETSGNEIKGTHETPVKHYIDDLTFNLNDNAERCSLQGHSRSRVWYAVLDYGTNYCNIHNLVEGARLNETEGYKEKTSDSVCTQYSSADCDVY